MARFIEEAEARLLLDLEALEAARSIVKELEAVVLAECLAFATREQGGVARLFSQLTDIERQAHGVDA